MGVEGAGGLTILISFKLADFFDDLNTKEEQRRTETKLKKT